MQLRQVISVGKLLTYKGWSIIRINVEKDITIPMWDGIFQTSQPALFATTSDDGKAHVWDKHHNHSYHVLSRKKAEELAGETTMQDSVKSRYQIYSMGGVFILPQSILNV